MLAVLRLRLALLITWFAVLRTLLITWFAVLRTLLIARFAILRTLLIAWFAILRTLLIARFAILRTLLIALLVWWTPLITRRLLIARALAIAGRTLLTRFTRRLFSTRNGDGGSAILCALVRVCAVITLGIITAVARSLTVRILRDGVAIGIAATTAATTTTTTTTAFAWKGGIVRMAFAIRRRHACAILLCEIGDGGGIEHFRLGRRRFRGSGGDQFAWCDLLRFVGDDGSRCGGSDSGNGGFSGSC